MESRRHSKRSSESPEGSTKDFKRKKRAGEVDKENASNGVLIEDDASSSSRPDLTDEFQDDLPSGEEEEASTRDSEEHEDEALDHDEDDDDDVEEAEEEEENTPEDEEEDEGPAPTIEKASGRKKRSSSSAFSNSSAEVGVILKVFVQDFMCHRKLTVDLNRNINFIHGQNGSGAFPQASLSIRLTHLCRQERHFGSHSDLPRCQCSSHPPRWIPQGHDS